MSFKKEFFKKSPVRHNMPEYGFKNSNSKLSLGSSGTSEFGKVVDENGDEIPANSKIAREHYKELMNKLYGNSFVSSSGGKPSDRELLINRGDSKAEVVLPVAKPSQQTEREKELEVLKSSL